MAMEVTPEFEERLITSPSFRPFEVLVWFKIGFGSTLIGLKIRVSENSLSIILDKRQFWIWEAVSKKIRPKCHILFDLREFFDKRHFLPFK